MRGVAGYLVDVSTERKQVALLSGSHAVKSTLWVILMFPFTPCTNMLR